MNIPISAFWHLQYVITTDESGIFGTNSFVCYQFGWQCEECLLFGFVFVHVFLCSSCFWKQSMFCYSTCQTSCETVSSWGGKKVHFGSMEINNGWKLHQKHNQYEKLKMKQMKKWNISSSIIIPLSSIYVCLEWKRIKSKSNVLWKHGKQYLNK